MKNIFVLGLDEPNRATLSTLPDTRHYRFHQLLTVDELRHGETIPVRELLEKAAAELDSFRGSIDAVIGFWDFLSRRWCRACVDASGCAQRRWRRSSHASTRTGAGSCSVR